MCTPFPFSGVIDVFQYGREDIDAAIRGSDYEVPSRFLPRLRPLLCFHIVFTRLLFLSKSTLSVPCAGRCRHRVAAGPGRRRQRIAAPNRRQQGQADAHSSAASRTRGRCRCGCGETAGGQERTAGSVRRRGRGRVLGGRGGVLRRRRRQRMCDSVC